MVSRFDGWSGTRTTIKPSQEIPPRPPGTVAFAESADGTAEVRIVRRADGLLTFEIEAWANFEDAGGGAHVTWHTFHPSGAVLTETLDQIVEYAKLDSLERGLRLGSFHRI